MGNQYKQLNQKNFKKKPNLLMKAIVSTLCISTFSFSAQAAINNIAFEDDLKTIKISWDAVSDDSHVGYNVYRKDNLADAEGTIVNDTIVSGTGTRFSTPVLAKNYYFYVESVDIDGNVLDTSDVLPYALVDADNDGMGDDWENYYDLNNSLDDSAQDLDVDGLTNLQEYQSEFEIKPNYADTDGDGIDDGFESAYEGLDPSVEDSSEDADADGFSNLAEFEAGSNPALYNETPDDVGGGVATTTTTFAVLGDGNIDKNKSKYFDNELAGGVTPVLKLTVDRRVAYLRFDTSALTDGVTITNASLNLTGVAGFDASVHSTTNAWTYGADTSIDGSWPEPISLLDTQDLSADVKVGFDVTSAIIDGELSFALTTTQGGTKNIYSSEQGGDAAPSLDVTYSEGAVDLPPSKVENFTAAEGVSAVNLTWDAAVDGDGTVVSYNVYRRANQNFLFGDPVANVTSGTAYTDSTADADHHYQYIITAVDDGGNESNSSAVLDIENVTGTGVTTDPKPAIVDKIVASDNTSAIKISWAKVDDLDLAGYNIYRNDILLNTESLLKKTASNYSDFTVNVNTEYQYRVEAVDEAGQMSDASEVITYTLLDTDNDGMSDHFEEKYSGDIFEDGVIWDVTTPEGDADEDGLNNLAEYTAATNPTIADTDADGMPDGFEVANALDPLDKDDAELDADGDTFTNLEEYLANTDIHDAAYTPINPNGVEQFYATINPIADTYVTDQYPDSNSYTITSEIEGVEDVIVNFNDATELSLSKSIPEGFDTSIHQIAFLKFDVGQIDMNEGSPLKTILRLHRTGNSVNDVAVYKVTDNSWDSAALTWNTQPTQKVKLVNDISIPGNKIDKNTGEWESEVHLYAEIDVSSSISSGEKVSFAVIRLDDIDKARSMDSSESDFKPELVITYTKESMDLDFDGLPDFWELQHGLDTSIDDSALDLDGDGLTNLEEYNLGLNPNNTDSDGDGVSDKDEVDNGTSPSVPDDFAAPVFDEQIDAVVIDATGILTDITEALLAANIVAYDDFDGVDIVATISEDQEVLLASGQHSITLEATDIAGHTATKDISVHINPQVDLGLDLIAEAGSQLLIPVTLSGVAANYPVTVDYQVSVNEESTPGQVTFIQDAISTDLVLSISDEAQTGDKFVISFTGATNAVVDETTELIINIENENFVPTVAIKVSQADTLISSISPTSGLVTITADVSDLNMNNEHSITFEVIDNVFSDDESDELANTFTFDPAYLESGNYHIKVTVAETNTIEQFAIEVTTQLLVDATLTEVAADSDQDGIPDALDNDHNVTRLPIASGELPISVASGLKLSLGDYAQGNTFASINIEQLEPDEEFDLVSTITNFKVEGLGLVGDSVTLILPLAQSISIPDTAAYRKYTEAKGWFDFVQDENNSLGSALKDADGNCPTPGSDYYLAADLVTPSGLLEGKECIQLTIEDGGPNDADGLANGIVVDPGALVIDHVNIPPVVAVENVSAVSNSEVSVTATSTDYEGDTVSYSWVQITGPSVFIEGTSSSTMTFTAPEVLEATTLSFEVVASDGIATSSQTVDVLISPSSKSNDGGGSFSWLLSLMGLIALSRKKLPKK